MGDQQGQSYFADLDRVKPEPPQDRLVTKSITGAPLDPMSDESLMSPPPSQRTSGKSKGEDTLFQMHYLPLLIYAVVIIAVILLVFFNPGKTGDKSKHLALGMVWFLLWGIVIFLLCYSRNVTLAWILMLIPVVLWIVLAVGISMGWIKSFTNDGLP